MREFLVVVIFLFGLAFTLLATSVIQDAVSYRDVWHECHASCVLIKCGRRQQ